MISLLIYYNHQFSKDIIVSAIQHTDRSSHHPIAAHTEIPLTQDVTAVSYDVGGYHTAAECFNAQNKFFLEEGFVVTLTTQAKQQRESFCFYTCLYSRKDKFLLITQYNEKGFDERKLERGVVTRRYSQEGGAVVTDNFTGHDKETVRYTMVENYLEDQFKISIQDLISAHSDRKKTGAVITGWADIAQLSAIVEEKLKRRDTAGVSALYDQALAILPRDTTLLRDRARFRRDRTGDRKGAVTDLSALIGLVPENVEYVLERAALYDDLIDKKGALADCERAVTLCPHDASILFRKGKVRLRFSDMAGIDDIIKALDMDPGLKEMVGKDGVSVQAIAKRWNSQSCELINQKKFDEALNLLHKALEMEPHYGMAFLTIAETYTAMGQKQEAIHWLEKGVKDELIDYKEIDQYSCFAPLRVEARYQAVVSGAFLSATHSTKSFYLLEMYVEPGGIREYFRFLSGSIHEVEKVVLAVLKGPMGLKKLLSYGQHALLHRYENNVSVRTVNLLPAIKLLIPAKELIISFREDGAHVITGTDGETKHITVDVANDTVTIDQDHDAAITVLLESCIDRIGRLEGEPVGDDEYIQVDAIEADTGTVEEAESGNRWKLDRFIDMMNRNV